MVAFRPVKEPGKHVVNIPDSASAVQARRAIALVIGAIVLCGVLFKMGFGVIADADTFWHIKTGQWIIENRQWPHVDVFSHTFRGEPWIAKEWLSQVIMHAAYELAGWKGILLLTACSVALTAWILASFCLSRYRWSVAVAATFVMLQFASLHFLARPVVLAIPILLIWTIELAKAADERRLPRWWMFALLILWVNMHGGFTLGLVLAGIFAAETVWKAPSGQHLRTAMRHAAFLIGLLLATLINPYGYEALLISKKILDLSTALRTIVEWQSPDFQVFSYHLYVLTALLALALLSGVRVRSVRLIAVLLLFFMMLTYTRALPNFGLLLPVILATPLVRQFPALKAQTTEADWSRDAVLRTLVAHRNKASIAAIVLLLGAGAGLALLEDFDLRAKRFPHAAVAFARQSGVSGPVYNDYSQGGYLIWQGIAPAIDGRAELYGDTFYRRYFRSVFDPRHDTFFAFLDEMKVTWTLLAPGSPAIQLLEMSPGWRCVFADESGIVHVRNEADAKAAEPATCSTGDGGQSGSEIRAKSLPRVE